MLTALLGLLTIAAPLGAVDAHAFAASARHHDAPGIRVWISSQDLFRHGDRARVYYRTERDAFVTVLRVDTDGRIEMLFPRSPEDDNYAYGGTTYSVSRVGHNEAFVVNDDPGMGYLFAVASDEPFDYHALLDGEGWDVRLASGGRVHGDPQQMLEEMVVQTLPPGFTDFDTHLIPYYVERRYDYPRFVCYDCHAYTPYAYWDPYSAWCPRYTLVVWNDPFYYYPSYWYPTRYYGGTRVVYSNPGSSSPQQGRYVFKDRGNHEPGIDYRDRRTTGTGTPDRRSGDRFVRATDVGGVGSVPVPGRRTTDPARRQTVDVPSGGEGLTPAGAMDARRRTVERQDAGSLPADTRRGTGVVPTQPTLTPEAPAGRRNTVLWQSPEAWRQQPAATERRSTGGGTQAEPQSGGRQETAPSQRGEPERRAAPSGNSKTGTQAAPANGGSRSQPSARGGSQPSSGGSQPSPRSGSRPSSGGSQPSARGSSGSGARPSAPSSGGSRPASPGLVRRRPS